MSEERLDLFSKVCECGNIGTIKRIFFLVDKPFQCSYCKKMYSRKELDFIHKKEPTEDNLQEIQEILKSCSKLKLKEIEVLKNE